MSETTQLIEALSAEEMSAIETEAQHLPDRASAAIEALRIVQEKRGWISDESLAAIARLLNMSVESLDGIATFYNLLFRRPVGRHVIMVCDSVSCYIMGCDRVRSALSEALDIAPGETTADGRFTLLPVVCLGACDVAPALSIDGELVGNVGVEDVSGLLERYP
jgi:NADH-quinone oxidoreductase subunit E